MSYSPYNSLPYTLIFLELQYNRPVARNKCTGILDRQFARHTFLLSDCSHAIFKSELEIGVSESDSGGLVLETEDDDPLHPDAVQGISESVASVVCRELNSINSTVGVLRSEVLAGDRNRLFSPLRSEPAPDEVTLAVIVRFAVVEVQFPTSIARLAESHLECEGIALHQGR